MMFAVSDIAQFTEKALRYACNISEDVFFLDSNEVQLKAGAFPKVLAFGASRLLKPENNSFENLKEFQQQSKSDIFGFLSYDLKNEVEILESNLPYKTGFPNMCFIEPEVIIEFEEIGIYIHSVGKDAKEIFNEIEQFAGPLVENQPIHDFQCNFSREEYIDTVKRIQRDIHRGDIYEMNVCIEFFAKNTQIDPISVFLKLNTISPMPFAGFVKHEENFLLCASPERFLKKEGDKLISQPIKGTIRRGDDAGEDEKMKAELLNSEKERAENMMIVDLVRNDLSHTAKDGSVAVEELCGIYTFRQVHQMISTVVATQSRNFHFTETLKNCFPMGSMTGAPKISAMNLIEQYERTKRGLFSGSIGFITPEGDFDFNVVIRSILYNSETGYLSFQAGSAITSDADPERELEECILKTQAVREALT
jgi:para-aminobenzoate synthetase component 1